ncbi:flagellar hook-length control protein FliK [Proteus myxofaciens]|uniref:FliK family flagellar hook-length control protein n=1 Tax=Proteus myxofaciens ATCC 19692 TaxID=1354337 RepID=A0A198GIJ1_9GAMM|nr:flagellar hook-length control protein FliK [Proteus myxofaciens]OAT36715.1 FliK family flagellar hook-length control protein [Proteus myxofaciens ATCC 19692]
MEITLLNMDVVAPSPGSASATNSQPGENAPTFAQFLSTHPQNSQSDKKTVQAQDNTSKEKKVEKHSQEDKDKDDTHDIASVVADTIPNKLQSQEKLSLTLSLPDNEQLDDIIENKIPSSLMSAEELAAELPVQLAGLPGLKRTLPTSEQLKQSVKHEDKLSPLTRVFTKETQMTGIHLTDNNVLSKFDEKSLLTQLRPETSVLATQGTQTDTLPADKSSTKKADTFASLLTPVSEKIHAQLNSNKSQQNTKLTENVFQQIATNNSTSEKELHNTLTTTSSLTSHSLVNSTNVSAISQPQVHFSPTVVQVLNAQVGTPEWQQQFNQQIVMFSRNGLQKAELRLHPEELGSLQIRMKIEDGQAQLHLTSQNGHVRNVLENAIHHLRQALSDNGIQLTQSHVSSDNSNNWQQENMSDSSQFSGKSADNHQGSEDNDMQLTSESAQQKITLTPQQLASARGGVDIFA